ncbi:MAG TPA: TonB-dependent receptor [Sphingomonas sp.]|nr:TonB-dependent receptor [Sphingomonas sp.]
MGTRAIRVRLLCGLALTALSVPAMAQETSNPSPAPDGTSSNASTAHASATTTQPTAQQSSDQIPTIIVNARRRNESIQTTPVAITAISPAQLAAKGTITIGDLQGAAPNVLITQQPTGATAANISIRGIAFADVEKSFDPSVGVYVDGVYIGTSTGQFLDFFDIASIEILRGPQGTLFGRNTIAGVINIRRTRPTGEWGGKFQADLSSYGTVGLRGVVNVPVIKDVLAAKFFEFHEETQGYLKDARTGRHIGGSNNENFGTALLFTPSSNFDALLTLEEQQQHYQPYFGSLLETGDVFCPFVPPGACNGNKTTDPYHIYSNLKPIGYYRARAATLEMNWDTGPVKLTSISSYRESREHQHYDIGSSDLYIADRRQTYHQFSEELRAAGKVFPGLDYVAGLYYFDSRYQLLQTTDVFGAFAGAQNTIGKSRSEAAFIDLDWQFAPHFRLSGGGRYTWDHKAYENPLLYTGAAKKSWSKFTPKVTLDWRPNDRIMLYATWSQGYRSGGFNGRGLTVYSASTPYDPETVNSYEVGLKSEFFNRKVAFNIDGFYTDYKHIQESSTITLAGGQGNQTVVTNAAGARIKGIEADLTARPIRNLTLRSSVGYTNAHFRGFIVKQPVTLADGSIITRTFDFSNVDMIFAPKWTISVNGDYAIPIGRNTLTITAGYRHITPYDQQIAPDPALYPMLLANPNATGVVVEPRNDPRVRTDHQNLVDASISMTFPMNDSGAKARVALFGRNLLDDRGPAFAFTVAAYPNLWAYSSPREPRVVGVQFGFEF